MTSKDLADVLRWEAAGGTWQVLARGPDGVELALTTCAGCEVMSRLHSCEPDLIAHVEAG